MAVVSPLHCKMVCSKPLCWLDKSINLWGPFTIHECRTLYSRTRDGPSAGQPSVGSPARLINLHLFSKALPFRIML